MSEIQIGEQFGKWTALGRVRAQWGGRERNLIACRCDCGTEKAIPLNDLRVGNTTQCRTCGNRQKAALKSRLTHGMTDSRLHRIWTQMRKRCDSKSCPDYPRYGGRGISVCAEWQAFEPFQRWADQNGYADHLTLDRRDNDHGYCPENCRWIGRTDQNRNRRDNKRYPFAGRMMMVSEIAEITGQPLTMLRQRIQTYGWSIDRATTEPARQHRTQQTNRKEVSA
ncbi:MULTISPECIES: hypothetical protein [unclassified Novosphingobium]|uniref:hypothetical protein n=1 Tax=unclassified Novosphingobium TaxID=2644732 RepID=UPI000D495077|nr:MULTISPECIES: hypothetical protein [unclassified Novosphingobium]PTR05390.1 hypothetical protein C8K11_13417 [Novosphingobium sp. GV055]PUA93954.1 hypothetical protein C8K12_13417 [Novosphingobium sp. GV061]PUB11371.1 hypothetical protein C8K14_13417 [Novosphingobium sp. GV079]PUB37061.1 hypothetical protein C8K10_13417 [Novosphingobium sp. GV027]